MKIKRFFFSINFIQEITIILLVVLVSIIYLEKEDIIIKADGKGYYEYLPAVFIYNDLHWGFLDTLDTPGYYNHRDYDVGALKEVDGVKVNKYFIGTALLMSPFFLWGHLWAGITNQTQDGYTKPYQQAMWFSALFYLLLGLIFLRKLLVKLKIKLFVVFTVQLLMVFATPLLHYVTFEPTFSHVYSFFTVTTLIYYCLLFIKTKQNKYLYLITFLCFLTLLIRPFNIIILLILPFFFQEPKECFSFIKSVINNKKLIILKATLLGGLFLFVQVYVWYIQTGNFIIDSYSNETFDFSSPEIINILFSYKKGLFIYSPILFLGFGLGITFFLVEKKYFKAIFLIVPFLIFTYVLSSWWSWWYAMSYGQRSYIDILVLFAIITSYGLNQLSNRALVLIIPFFLLTIPITVIQNFQYKNYILHWEGMDKNSFWEVFLKTDEKYRGVLWQEKYSYKDEQEKEVLFLHKKIFVNPQSSFIIVDEKGLNIFKQKKIDLIEAQFGLENLKGKARLILALKDKDDNIVYWHQFYTHLQLRGDEKRKRVVFQYKIDEKEFLGIERITFLIETEEEKAILEDCQVNIIAQP